MKKDAAGTATDISLASSSATRDDGDQTTDGGTPTTLFSYADDNMTL